MTTYEEPWYVKVEREEGEKLAALRAQSFPETEHREQDQSLQPLT